MRARRASVADALPFSWVDGPGNRFVLFLQGCNLDCLACHNPQTIPLTSTHARTWSVEDALAAVHGSMPYISGVTVSGGEPTVQAEFVGEFFAGVKTDPELGRLTTFLDTNGTAPLATWQALAPVLDGCMVDLKALDDERHRALTGHSNEPVLASIRHLAAEHLLYEVRLMLAPGQNDSEADLREVARWLLAVDPDVRVKVNGFRHHGVRAEARQWPEATVEDVERYRATLLDEGIASVA